MKEGPDTKNDQHIKEIFKEKQNENLTSYRVGAGNPFFLSCFNNQFFRPRKIQPINKFNFSWH